MRKKYCSIPSLYVALASLVFVGTAYAGSAKETTPLVEVYATQLPAYAPKNDYGSFVIRMDAKANLTEQEFLAKANAFFGLNDNNTFQLLHRFTDALGAVHTTYQHSVGKYPVDGQMFIVHSDKKGRVTAVNGTIIAIENKKSIYSLRGNTDKKPLVSKEKALDIALTANKVTQTKQLDFPVETVFVRSAREEGIFVLAHKVRVDDLSGKHLLSKNVFIGVETGEVVNEVSLLAHANVTGSGSGHYRSNLSLDLTLNEGVYTLDDKKRKIQTMDGTAATELWDIYSGEGEVIQSSTPTFATSPANDVHWGLAKTYDYYYEVHGRASYDDMKGEIKAFYDPILMDNDKSGFPNNAVAMGVPFNVLVFGRGSEKFNPLTALDITGHEFTHLVVSNNGNGGLRYQGESGALNEGFADIFGTSIEFYSVMDADWYLGNNVLVGNPSFMRSMKNPKEGRTTTRQPNTYRGEHWADTKLGAWDNGGVHINSGVINYWYYLLCEGGSGITDEIKDKNGVVYIPAKEYIVSPIGMQKAEQIAYLTLISQLASNAQYIDAVEGTLTVAQGIYGLDSEEYGAVYDAWYAVGLRDDPRENMGIEDFELTADVFSMYPNPVSNGVLTVLIKDEKGTVTFYNMAGQKVTSDFAVEKGENKIQISHLQTGNYIAVYESKERKITEKIIVK